MANAYSSLGIDDQTAGYLSQAGVDPSSTYQQSSQQSSSTLSAYPTYPNSAGVGSQTAGSTTGTTVQAAPQAVDATSRGLSPYSLLGDANYRQR